MHPLEQAISIRDKKAVRSWFPTRNEALSIELADATLRNWPAILDILQVWEPDPEMGSEAKEWRNLDLRDLSFSLYQHALLFPDLVPRVREALLAMNADAGGDGSIQSLMESLSSQREPE